MVPFNPEVPQVLPLHHWGSLLAAQHVLGGSACWCGLCICSQRKKPSSHGNVGKRVSEAMATTLVKFFKK